MSWKDSLVIGLAQALAILPGISRSGSTISAGLLRQLKPAQAFEFSFLLSIPAILGAFVLQIADFTAFSFSQLGIYLAGFTAAAISGWLALQILHKIIKRGKLYYFSWYCLALALLVIYIHLTSLHFFFF